MTKTQSLLSILVVALATACSSSGDTVGVQMRASTGDTDPSPTATLEVTDDGGLGYEILTARVYLRQIELDLPDGASCADVEDDLVNAECDDSPDDSDKIRIPGPFDVDLVTGTSTPDLGEVEIPAGTYRRIDFRVEDDPDDVSFEVTAAFTHDGDPLELALALDFNEDIRVEHLDGVDVSGDTDLVAEFVVGNWLGGVDIGSCIDDGDVVVEGNIVHVDDGSTSGSCSAIEDTIKDNMKNSAQLDRD